MEQYLFLCDQESVLKLEPFDYVCGIFSVLALILWAVTKNADLTILFAILSDASAAVPTVIKSWIHPETEYPCPFFTGLFSAGTAFLAIDSRTFSVYAFPVCLVIANIVILSAIYRKKLFVRSQDLPL